MAINWPNKNVPTEIVRARISTHICEIVGKRYGEDVPLFPSSSPYALQYFAYDKTIIEFINESLIKFLVILRLEI